MCFTTACTDLTPEVYGDVTSDNYFTTPEQFSNLIANAYAQMIGEYGYVYREGYWSMQEYTTDEVVIPTRGTDWYDNGVPIAMHQHTWVFNTRDINNGWSFAYGGTAKCNNVLNNIKEIKGEDESKYDEATWAGIAEAKTLRAFYHFLLVQGWYEVPIRTESINDVNSASLAATSHAEALKWIIKEMEDCVDMVDDSAYDKSPSYVKKNTVMGILARVYLWSAGYPNNGGKADYEKAAYWANEVKKSGKHQLNPDFESLWKMMCGDQYDAVYNESIWEAEFYGSRDDGNMTMGRIGNTLGNLDKTTKVSSGFCAGTLLLWDLYSADDPRRDVTMCTYSIDKNGKHVAWKADQIIKRTCGKFRREWEPAYSANKNWTPENFPLLRYSDVLLMLAEAENEVNQGPTALAYECINLVRARALQPELTAGLDYAAFKQEVMDERARELTFEALRKYDLIRWGIYLDRIKNDLGEAVKDKRWKNGTNETNNDGGVSAFIKRTAEKHQFLPIPEKELAVNLLLEQNKYWK